MWEELLNRKEARLDFENSQSLWTIEDAKIKAHLLSITRKMWSRDKANQDFITLG